MRQFLFRLIITTLTVMLTAFILPGFRVEGNTIWAYLGLGLLLGLLNSFVRPFVILAFGKVIMRTMGLFLIVINALMLLLIYGLQLLFNFELIGFNSWLAVFLAGLVIGLLSAVLDILFGLNRPTVADKDENALLWAWIDSLPSVRRSRIVENLRFQEVFDTLWTFGLNIAFSGGIIGTMRATVGGYVSPGDPGLEDLNAPAKVRIMLQKLGPTYVKIGQIISSRAEALPPDWREELSKLQSDVAPFPTAEAYQNSMTNRWPPRPRPRSTGPPLWMAMPSSSRYSGRTFDPLSKLIWALWKMPSTRWKLASPGRVTVI
jgi:putative membrane protein